VDDRLSLLEARVRRLTELVEALEQRILVLEGRPAAETTAAAALEESAAVPAATAPGDHLDVVSALSLVGRLFIVLGGGYFLRAMTEAGTLPPLGGVAAGLLYAAAWAIAADRAAAAGKRWSATFHGAATALIGLPLLWESATRFKALTPAAAAAVLAVFLAVPLAVACRRRLQTMAWVATLVALGTVLALVAGTGQVVPFALVLVALGTATLWMGYSLDWIGLRWPVAAVADLVVSALTLRALSPEPMEPAAVTLLVQVLLVAAYLASIGVRTLVRDRNVVPFEVVQTTAVLVIGFGGAVAVARATGAGVDLLGWICVAFGAASYAVAWVFLDRKAHLSRNVYFYTSVAIVVVLAGSALLWGGSVLVVLWSILAVGACALWARIARFFLLIHGGVYLAAAGMAVGLFGYGAAVILGRSTAPWVVPTWHHLVVLAAAALCAWFGAADGNERVRSIAHVPRLLIVLVLVWAAGTEVIGALTPVVAGLAMGAVDPGILATLRTSILSLSVLAVAYIGRQPRFAEWGWLVYPLLVVIGLKMIAQDFSASRPATLFVAFALYGVALIVGPRLRRGAASTN
jgi:hypothetical protein